MTKTRCGRLRNGAWTLLALVLSTALGGCGGGAQDELPPGDPVPRQGSIRVVNAIPDAPNVTALLSGAAFASLDFGQASALNKQLVGIYNMRLLYVDPDGDPSEIVPVERIELTQEDEVNLVLLGTWAQPRLVRFDNTEIDFGVTSRTDADVQVVHAATGAGPVDVYLTDSGADLAGATPLASVSPGDVGALRVVPAAANQRLRVTTAGTTTVLFDSGPFEIVAFTRTVFLVRDYFGPGTSTLRVSPVGVLGAASFPNEPLETSLLFANFVADAPSVDVYLVDTTTPPAFTSVAFGTRTARQSSAAGARDVKLTPAGVTTPFVLESTTTLVPGTFQTIFAGGLDTGDTAGIASVIDDIRPIATEARLRLDHAAAAAGTIDAYITAPGASIAAVSPTLTTITLNSRRIVPLLPGSYDVTITRSGSKVSLAGPEPIAVELGGVYTLALTDSAGGGAPVELRRFDDLAP